MRKSQIELAREFLDRNFGGGVTRSYDVNNRLYFNQKMRHTSMWIEFDDPECKAWSAKDKKNLLHNTTIRISVHNPKSTTAWDVATAKRYKYDLLKDLYRLGLLSSPPPQDWRDIPLRGDFVTGERVDEV